MLRKKAAIVCGAVMMSLGAAACVQAEEVTEVMTEAAVETEAVTEEAETEAAEEAEEAAEVETEAAEIVENIVIQVEGSEPVSVANTAKLDITAVSVEAVEDAEEEGLVNVTLASREGVTYEFLKVNCADMQEPQLVVEGAFAYIKYTGIASGKERSIGQTGELLYEEPAELFAVDQVYIRAAADSDSEAVGVISRGDAIEVLGETASHYKVRKGDIEGYSVRSCISQDEQDAIAAVQAEEAARAEIQRQAEAAAAARAAASSAKTEVKRQKFDDCDGSGHGYYLITYSDGSTGVIEY